ncbi:hypothetical protein HT031_005011 [Scenedesmus sp. PABB004]|nr:hypothetical protein HT031_005011 [Scenedesmus sp. PABB004]
MSAAGAPPPPDLLATPYLDDCRLLRALAAVLALPPAAAVTAFAFLHRARGGGHAWTLSGQELVTACIYVAAKVEEVNVSANQLINAARLLAHPSQRRLLEALAPLQREQQERRDRPGQQQPPQAGVEHGGAGAHGGAWLQPQLQPGHQQQQQETAAQQQQQQAVTPGPPSGEPPQPGEQRDGGGGGGGCGDGVAADAADGVVAVGDVYYAAKDRLFTAEQVLLRLMGFQLVVPQPHKHLFNFCRLLGASRAVAGAGAALLNDALAYTRLAAACDAAVLAAAALQLAGARVAEQHAEAAREPWCAGGAAPWRHCGMAAGSLPRGCGRPTSTPHGGCWRGWLS